MENKKSKTGLHVFVGILLGIIICGGVVFATYSLGYLTFGSQEEPTEVESNNESNDETTDEDTSANSLDFDTSKVVNGNETQYYLTNYNSTINIRLDETRQIVTLNYNRKILELFNKQLQQYKFSSEHLLETTISESTTIQQAPIMKSGLGDLATKYKNKKVETQIDNLVKELINKEIL